MQLLSVLSLEVFAGDVLPAIRDAARLDNAGMDAWTGDHPEHGPVLAVANPVSGDVSLFAEGVAFIADGAEPTPDPAFV
jgi:hypothetical protein